MQVGYLSFTSLIHDEEVIEKNSQLFLKRLSRDDLVFRKITEDEWGKYDVSVAFIRTGGTENLFKQFYNKQRGKILLLTYGFHNSLAAAMEILSFINQSGGEGEILHGSDEYIIEKLKAFPRREKTLNAFKGNRLGVIGKPSDWLIASNVNYNIVKSNLGIELVDIPMSELEELVPVIRVKEDDAELIELEKKNDKGLDILPAIKIYHALKEIVSKYHLDGLTIRCFDLLSSVKSTGCVSLSYLNSYGITGACEGDIPSLISMHFATKVLNEMGFQANPSFIDVDKNEVVFAHCTLPLRMVNEYSLDTHFESGIGVGIKGEFEKEIVTIFKIGNDLSSYFVSRAEILENLHESNLCRTQIRLKMDADVSYFLKNSLGNHHIIIKGDYEKEIDALLSPKMRKIK